MIRTRTTSCSTSTGGVSFNSGSTFGFRTWSKIENFSGFALTAHTAIANSADNELTASIYNDTLFGEAGADVLFGLGGDDRIAGGGGDDLIRGDDGADIPSGRGGNDTLSYGTDTIGVNVDIGLNTASGVTLRGILSRGRKRCWWVRW